MTAEEAETWRGAAREHAEQLQGMRDEMAALLCVLHSQIEALQLFAGGVLTAAGWMNGCLTDLEADCIIDLAESAGLIFRQGRPGAYAPTLIGSRALHASLQREKTGLN